MKTLLIALLLVSTSILAQDYYPYNQQYQYEYYDYERQLQQEFLDEQYANQQDLMNQQTFRMEVDRMEPERKRDRSTFPGW